MADAMALDDDLAAAGDGGEQLLGLARVELAQQMGGAAVDEARGQPLVERVRQFVLDLAGAGLPVRRSAPSRLGRRCRRRRGCQPGVASACRVAVRALKAAIWPASQSVGRCLAGDVTEDAGAQAGVGLVGELAKIGDLTSVPEQPGMPAALRQGADFRLAGQRDKCLQVRGVIAFHQRGARRRRGQAGQQGVDPAKSSSLLRQHSCSSLSNV